MIFEIIFRVEGTFASLCLLFNPPVGVLCSLYDKLFVRPQEIVLLEWNCVTSFIDVPLLEIYVYTNIPLMVNPSQDRGDFLVGSL